MPGPYPIAYPLINGHRFSFASAEIFLPGNPLPVLGITAVNYSSELMPGKVWGTRSKPLGRTRGKADAKGDMEMLRLEWENLKFFLGVGGVAFGVTAFDIQVVWSELPFSPVITDILVGCRITNDEYSNQEGTDPSKVKLTLDLMGLTTNGIGSIAGSSIFG